MDGREIGAEDAQRLHVVYAIQRLLALLHDEPTVLRESCALLAQYRGFAGVSIAYDQPDGGSEVVAAFGALGNHDQGVEVALEVGGEVAGSLRAHWPRERGFDEQEMELLRSVAGDVGRAIEAVRMRLLLAESAVRSRNSLGALETLWRLSTDRSGDEAEQAKAVLAEGMQTLGAQSGVVARIEGERIAVEWAGGRGRAAATRLPLDGEIVRRAVRQGATVVQEDGAAIAAPIPFAYGSHVLLFGSRTRRAQPFTEEDRTYVELLAALFGRLLEQRRQEDERAVLVSTDPITGLLNRTRFMRVLAQSLSEALKTPSALNLVLVVVDRFRELGLHVERRDHDRVLRTFADRLRGIVGRHGRLAYLGAAEFAVALGGPPERGEQLARVLGEAIALPVNLDGRELRCSASVGVAIHPRDADAPEALLAAADSAVVRAQREGGATVRFFNEEIGESLRLKRSLLQGLRYARQRQEFELHYQPVVDLSDGSVCAIEALLRWHDPQYGLRLPADFIEAAEESEAILPIDEWVMREAIHRSGTLVCGARRLPLSFNLSGSAVAHEGTLALLARIVRDEGADPAFLQLEVSERIASRQTAAARRLIEGVRNLGMKVALDDFGTGYASLMLIKQIPMDALKIDRSFVRDLPGSPEDEAIVRAAVTLGRSLGRRVVALGVERSETAAWLAAEGCAAGQGYWLSAPLPQEEFLTWLSMHE